FRPFATRDFSGFDRVSSSNVDTLAPRRPGVIGLYLRTAICYFPVSKISIASPSASVTIARFSSPRLPFVYPRRFTLPWRLSVFTDVTRTFQIDWTASLISVLFARRSTRNVYAFFSRPEYDFSETTGRMMTSRDDFTPAHRPPTAPRWPRRRRSPP